VKEVGFQQAAKLPVQLSSDFSRGDMNRAAVLNTANKCCNEVTSVQFTWVM